MPTHTWKLFQEVLHHQDDQTPVKAPTHTILGITVAADRYVIIRIHKSASESLLYPVYSQTGDSMVPAAATAYLVRDAKAFENLTKMTFNLTGLSPPYPAQRWIL
jgi:hypothetical protein